MKNAILSRRTALLGSLAAFGLTREARAQTHAKQAADLAVLTVGGLIEAGNRPPFNAATDRFFQQRNVTFRRAKTFTPTELAWLPQQTVRAKEPAGEVRFAGPYLMDVLGEAKAAAGAKTVRLVALDGYAIELPLADLAAQNWVLAHSADDKPLGIGDLGPLYLVRALVRALVDLERSEAENNNWVHSVFYIELLG